MVDNQNPNNPNDPGNPVDPYRSEMPQYSSGYGSTPGGYTLEDDPDELDSGVSSVAASQGRILFVLGGGVLVIAIVLYALFSGGDDTKQKADVSIGSERRNTIATRDTTPPPQPAPVPIPAPIPAPPPTPAPPPPPPPVPVQVSRVEQNANVQQADRRKSPMMAFGGRASTSSSSQQKATGFAGRDRNLVFSREYLSETGAAQATATLMGDMNYIVAQGKVIDAVLETAINTDLPGPLRAIVSRDVFAESGRLVLIPKGSRLIGTYNSSLKRGQTRVYVIWSRVIRPDGIDIKLDSPGIDQLGRAGVAGFVDNKYFEMFAAAFLTSSATIAMGVASDSLMDDKGTSSTNTSDGTTTSSGSAGSQAVLTGIRNFSTTTEDILRDILEQEPTITADQGTRIKVFVNRDLIMPPAVLEQLQIIQ